MTVSKPKCARKLALRVGAPLLVCLLVTPAVAQYDAFCKDCCESDARYFEPVDFDFDCQPIGKDCGYFFRYDKLSWAFRGHRTVIGDQTLNVQSEIIFPQTAFSEGTAPPTYQINNSVQDAPPESSFAWGERYEFGKFSGGSGWMVGIIDGPQAVSTQIYGFNEIAIPNTLPLVTRETPDVAAGFTPFLGLGPNDLSTSRNGFGSVHVNFATAPGYLLGFRDYWVNGPNNEPDVVTGGPGRVLFPTTVESIFVNGVLTSVQITAGIVGTGSTLLLTDPVDDLDGDLLPGFFVVLADLDFDGVPETPVANGVDFDDLHMFNIRFDTLIVRNSTETQGFEIMRTHELSNRHHTAKGQRSQASVGVGLRYLRLRDDFYWEGRGDVLGLTFADTTAQNSIVGPQIRGIWNTQRGRWKLGVDGRFVFGANIQDQEQFGAVGQDLVPGGINRSAIGQPHAVKYGRHKESFSPVAELRAEASYQVTNSIALKLGYTGMFVDNITRASQTVRWFLPDLGLLEGGQQDIFINGVNFGFEVVH